MSYGMAKVKPSGSTCSACLATDEMFNVVSDCSKCGATQEVEILQFVKSFWGSTAICKTKDGSFIEAGTDRLKTDIEV